MFENDILEKYISDWDKVNADIRKGFNNEPAYDKKVFKTEITSYGDEVTDFYDKEISKMDTCLAVISLDYALKKINVFYYYHYYPQVFLKQSKYVTIKVFRHITQDIGSFLATHLKNSFFFIECLKSFSNEIEFSSVKFFLL